MRNIFLAKSSKNIKYADTIENHTSKLLNLFNDFVSLYGNFFRDENELKLIKIACEIHDLGKMNSRFQKKIYKSSGAEYKTDNNTDSLYKKLNIDEIPHGVLSCCFLDINKLKKEFSKFEISVLATSIFHHHNRKMQDKNGFEIKYDKLEQIVEIDLKNSNNLYGENFYCEYDGIDENKIENGYLKISDKYNFWLKFIVVKGMLNKLDYAASTFLKDKEKFGLDTLEIASNDASEYIKKYFDTNNYKINECQKFMSENSDKSLVVIASTGIGKTEGALLWAKRSKTFYTLTIKVSINAIYERILKDNYYGSSDSDKEKVTFLHSDTRSMMMNEYKKDSEDSNEDDERKYLETRQLIHPFTVCTVDQLFYFVFKSLGTEKFPATLKYSKVIIDEIQSYSPDIIAFIIYGLKVILDLGGQFLIMTATLPPVVKHFLINTIGEDRVSVIEEKLNNDESEKKVIIRNKAFLKEDINGNIIQRHFIKYLEQDFDYSKIITHGKNKKVLVICNTVKRSQEVYTKLKEENHNVDINLLHSRFILEHRREKEKNILEFAKSNKIGIWISTQIVEASLDIDFDILYTDMCSADSLLQRMGRCYRNRVYKDNTANVFIHNNIEDKKSIGVGIVYDEDVFNLSAEYIKKYNEKIFTEEEKQEYINNVYNVEKLEYSKYYRDIEENLKTLEKLTVGVVDKNITERQFRNINNITIMPAVFYNQLEKEEVFELYNKASGREKLKLKDKIMNYTTTAHSYMINRKDREYINYKGINDICRTYLQYNNEFGLLNKIDDELEVNDRCLL